MDKNTKITIDPEKFAYHFVDSFRNDNVDNAKMLGTAKKQLFAYLAAYVLAQQFNESEARDFLSSDNANINNLSMGQFLKMISEKASFNAPKL